MLLLRKRAQQRAVADDVDDAGDAVAQAMHLAQRRRCEELAVCAGDFRTMRNRGGCLGFRKRGEVVAPGDALRELPPLDPSKDLAQLRLPDEDNLEELVRSGLEIGQQA